MDHQLIDNIESIKEKITSQEYMDLVKCLQDYRNENLSKIADNQDKHNKSIVWEIHKLLIDSHDEQNCSVRYAVNSAIKSINMEICNWRKDRPLSDWEQQKIKREIWRQLTRIRENPEHPDEGSYSYATAIEAIEDQAHLVNLSNLIKSFDFTGKPE